MKQPHKHAALIKAWADGAEIQIKSIDGDWLDLPNPDTEPHGVTDGRCNWCGQPTKERIKALSDNIRDLLGHYDQQQATTAKLFEICLEFLDEKQTGHGVYISNEDIQRAGGVFKAERAALIKRKERKQQLIAAIKGYIKMINEREKKDV